MVLYDGAEVLGKGQDTSRNFFLETIVTEVVENFVAPLARKYLTKETETNIPGISHFSDAPCLFTVNADVALWPKD